MMISNKNTKILDDIEVYKQARDYWIKQFDDCEVREEFFQLNSERPTHVQKKEYLFTLEADLISTIQRITGNQPIVFYSYCVCALQLLIHRLSGHNKVYISSPVCHTAGEIEGTNDYIILTNEFHKDMTIRECLNHVHRSVVQGYLNQHYPWEGLLKTESIKKSYSMHQIILEYDTIHQHKEEPCDFHLRMHAGEEDVTCTLHYNELVFSNDMVQRICHKWRNLLQQMASQMECLIQDINIITPEERNLLNSINSTDKSLDNKTVIELFEQQALMHPELTSLMDGDKVISYKTLNHRANQIARFLQKKGIKKDDVVGIMMPRCIEFVEGILGVLKAGAAYVPIDIEYPVNRKKYILSDSKVSILLCSEGMNERDRYDCECYELNDELGRYESDENLDFHPQKEDLAYVIYTSGSTGKPKGVMIEHAGLSNYIIWARNQYLNKDGLRMPLYSQISFDLTVTSIYTPLISGNAIVIYGNAVENSIEKIVKDNLVDVVKLTPSHLKIMQEIDIPKDTRIKGLIVGGEKLERYLAENITKMFHGNIRIYNEYGPTEATVGCMIYQYCEEDSKAQVSIGKPIDNMQIYVLDQYHKECAINSVGEIYIGGIGLARGYRENVALTKDRFLSDIPDIGNRVYRTGDLARWCEDGNLEYLGRLDDQVKINGYRIELDEIKEKLQSHPEVKEAVVVDRTNPYSEKQYLCAYIIPQSKVTAQQLKEYLRSEIPEYMVPNHYVFLTQFPLNSNGKLDKKRLPEPDILENQNTNYMEPQTPLEQELVELWARALGLNKVGVLDSFLDMGGDSITMLKLQAMIHRKYSVNIPVSHFYQEYTIQKMAEDINSTKQSQTSKIGKAADQEVYEASNAQKRLYTLQKTGQVGTSYNIPMVYEIHGSYDVKRMEDAIKSIIERHEILRTSFHLIDSRVVQRIEANPDFQLLQFQDQKDEFDPEDWIEEFDLRVAPLLRAKLIHNHKNRTFLMIDMHHIISDGVTMELFYQEFEALYAQKQLPPVEFQYKDFSEWQNHVYAKSEKKKLHEEYWKNQFQEEIRPLDVATDHKRPKRKSYGGNNFEFCVNASITKQIKDFAREHGCTVFMVLLSAYEILLSRYSGESDVIIGTPVMGRPYTEFQLVMGMFVNSIALRNKVEGKKTYAGFLEEVKETAMNAYEHQDYPFDELIEVLQLKTDSSRNPLFDFMFVMQNPSKNQKENTGLDLKLVTAKHNIAKLDLTLTVYEQEEEYHFNFEYNTDLYERDTIVKFAESLSKILDSILKDTDQTIASIEMITEEDSMLLDKINQTECNVPDKTLVELFEEQVEKTPQAIAVSHNNSTWTYYELNCRANQLARQLRERGIKDDIIGIMLERSMDFLVGILAIMKAGAAYVPIEVDYPPDRKSYILQDSKAKLLITKPEFMEQVIFHGECLEPNRDIGQSKAENLGLQYNPENLAYVIYTSGSTGRPKGVMIRQKNLVNYVLWAKKMYTMGKRGDMTLYSRLGFDLTVTSIYVPLISGNQVVVYGQEYGQFALKKIILENKVDIIKLTPAHLRMITEWTIPSDSKIHTFIVGGESLERSLADNICKLFQNRVIIYNEYGPTEATVGCMIYQYQPEDVGATVSIGRPADNVQIYVLGDERSLMPVNAPGEMYIGGASVAKGYLNNVDMTRTQFIENPFRSGSKLYKTGDLAKWKKDGNLEFLGRKDFQVKIRGFRVELEEIQNILLSLPQIKDAIIIDRLDKASVRYLCAYLVKAADISEEAIRTELNKKLPGYMIPSSYVFLKELPLTSNGKIDRDHLPEPENKTSNSYSIPSSPIETALLEIWKELLKRDDIGVEDNFFELGGDSIKAVQFEVEAEKQGIYHGDMLSVQIYETPTIRTLAAFIENTKK